MEEVFGGDGLAGGEDLRDDLPQGVVVDAAGSAVVGLLREVVWTDGETELGIGDAAAQIEAADVVYSGDIASCGEGEDVVGGVEDALAEEAACAGVLADVVVSDE